MKKSNLSLFFIKAVLVCIAFIFTGQTAFAQITLDLGVLADDFPSNEESSSNNKFTLETPETSVKKPTAPKKAKKAVPAKKTTVKSNPPKQKTTAKPKEKYQVKESAVKDEHDKLKPHASPAPKVKVISSNSYSPDDPQSEEWELIDNPETTAPKVSKHFLEKQKKEESESAVEDGETARSAVKAEETPHAKEQQDEQKEKDSKTKSSSVASNDLHALSTSSLSKTEFTETAKKETDEKHKKSKSSLSSFSVYPVSEKLAADERSALLSNEIPKDAATLRALNKKRLLLHILIFDKKSAELTEEMQNALNETALLMEKDKTKRLILYSYSSKNPDEPGKERQYALRRALAIRTYLTSKGILSLRIELRAQGEKGAGKKIPDRTDIVLLDR